MENPGFTVLMSVYKKEEPSFFDLSLQSILINQTLLPNEMVLVCDGPLTDELYAVIDKYQSAFPQILRVYKLENNVGLGQALNYGLDKCSYEWIARADSDDVCAADRFQKQIDYVTTHEVDILSSYIDEFDTDYTKPIRIKTMPLSHEELVKMAKFRNPINHMTAMFKKSVIINAGSYVHLPYVEDYYLWVRAIANGAKLANIGECLVHARIGNGMAKRRGNKKSISSWRTINKFMLEHKMINRAEYFRNMLSIKIFVYTPTGLRNFVYKKILRKTK